MALLGSLAAFLFELRHGPGVKLLATLDALTLGAFAVAGTQRTLEVGLHPGTSLLMGVITAAGGGIVRDVLSRQTPALMRAVPGYTRRQPAASIVCLALSQAGHPKLALLAGMLVGGALRLVSLRFGGGSPSSGCARRSPRRRGPGSATSVSSRAGWRAPPSRCQVGRAAGKSRASQSMTAATRAL